MAWVSLEVHSNSFKFKCFCPWLRTKCTNKVQNCYVSTRSFLSVDFSDVNAERKKDSPKTEFNRDLFRALSLLVEQNRVQSFLRQHQIQYQKTLSIVLWNGPHSRSWESCEKTIFILRLLGNFFFGPSWLLSLLFSPVPLLIFGSLSVASSSASWRPFLPIQQ